MTRLGMRVPPGFAVCVDGMNVHGAGGAGETEISVCERQRRWLQGSGKNRSRPAAQFEESSSPSHALWHEEELDAITRQLWPGRHDRVRVRCDRAGREHAGQMETFLNVLGRTGCAIT